MSSNSSFPAELLFTFATELAQMSDKQRDELLKAWTEGIARQASADREITAEEIERDVKNTLLSIAESCRRSAYSRLYYWAFTAARARAVTEGYVAPRASDRVGVHAHLWQWFEANGYAQVAKDGRRAKSVRGLADYSLGTALPDEKTFRNVCARIVKDVGGHPGDKGPVKVDFSAGKAKKSE